MFQTASARFRGLELECVGYQLPVVRREPSTLTALMVN